MAFFEKFAQKVNERVRETDEDAGFRSFDEVINESRTEKAAAQEKPANLNAKSEEGGNINLKFSRPEAYTDEEVSEIAEYLLDGYIVVLDVEAMSKVDVIRLLDFLNGVTYVTEGTITRRNQKTYVITPSNVNITD